MFAGSLIEDSSNGVIQVLRLINVDIEWETATAHGLVLFAGLGWFRAHHGGYEQ